MSEKKGTQTKKGRASKQRREHLRIGGLLGFELFNEPEGERSAEIIEQASALGWAIGDVEKFDLRPAYLIAGLLDGYEACEFDAEGQDKAKADAAALRLLEIAAEIDAEDDLEDDGDRGEASALRYLAMPEPKDKTSDEWRYWQLRHMEAALRGEDVAAHDAAVAFAATLIGELLAGDFGDLIPILPHLIILRQRRRKGGE